MKIKKAIDRIPGGLMLVPLLLGACVHTFAPHAGKFLGSFSNALITGTLPILAVWFFCMGASISLKATPIVLRKHPASADPLSESRENRHNHDGHDNHGLEPTLHHPLK
jgi:hypothetical protein